MAPLPTRGYILGTVTYFAPEALRGRPEVRPIGHNKRDSEVVLRRPTLCSSSGTGELSSDIDLMKYAMTNILEVFKRCTRDDRLRPGKLI